MNPGSRREEEEGHAVWQPLMDRCGHAPLVLEPQRHRYGPTRLCTRRGAPVGMQRTEIIYAEQIRLLYANAPAGFVATVLNVVLLAVIQWQVIAPPRLVTWLAAMLALTALRAVVGLALSAPRASAAGHRSVGHPLWPGDPRSWTRMGLRWRVVVSCRLAPASGVSGVCRRGHDRGRGRAALRTHGCVPEFCVPGGGADHCPFARARRHAVQDHGRDGGALYPGQYLYRVEAALHHSHVAASAL